MNYRIVRNLRPFWRDAETESVQCGSLDSPCSIREKKITKDNRKVSQSLRQLSSSFPLGITSPALDHPPRPPPAMNPKADDRSISARGIDPTLRCGELRQSQSTAHHNFRLARPSYLLVSSQQTTSSSSLNHFSSAVAAASSSLLLFLFTVLFCCFCGCGVILLQLLLSILNTLNFACCCRR